MRNAFELKADVHKNVAELRRYLGSAARDLSFAALAAILNERDGRNRSASSIQRWEEGAEPDYASTKFMAELADVTFEEFALGRAKERVPTVDRDAVPVAPPARPARPRAAGARRGR